MKSGEPGFDGWVDGLDRVTDGAEWECQPQATSLKQHVCTYSGCLRENSSPCSLWNADDARVRGIVEGLWNMHWLCSCALAALSDGLYVSRLPKEEQNGTI